MIDSAYVVRVQGELDVATAPEVHRALGSAITIPTKIVILDLCDVEFLDSTGLRTIVAADARAREQGRRLAIVRGPDAVHRVFSVTRLDDRLDIVDEPPVVEA
jgi:anti-anti-sigma factor